MATVPERQAPLPAALGGREEVDVNPPENLVLEPSGLAAKRVGPDKWAVQFLISPFKMVTVMLPGEAKALLVEQLTGGIVIPS